MMLVCFKQNLSNMEAEFKKSVAYNKACILLTGVAYLMIDTYN